MHAQTQPFQDVNVVSRVVQAFPQVSDVVLVRVEASSSIYVHDFAPLPNTRYTTKKTSYIANIRHTKTRFRIKKLTYVNHSVTSYPKERSSLPERFTFTLQIIGLFQFPEYPLEARPVLPDQIRARPHIDQSSVQLPDDRRKLLARRSAIVALVILLLFRLHATTD